MYFSKSFRGFHLWPCGIIVSRSELRQDLMTKAAWTPQDGQKAEETQPWRRDQGKTHISKTLKWPVFSKQVVSNFLYFPSNYDSANNKFIHEVIPNVSQSFAKAHFWTLLHGNQGFNKSLEKHFHTQLWWLASIFTWHYLEITLKESLKEGWSMLGWHVGMSVGDCLNSANW